jgi:uncharacterized protein
VTLTLFTGTGHLDLPVRPARTGDEELPPFAPPQHAPVPEIRAVTHNRGRRSREQDPTTGEIVSVAFRDGGENGTAALSQVPDIDLDFGDAFRRTHRIRDDDPLSANCELVQRSVLRRTGWLAQVDCRAELTADADQFRVRATLSASHNGEQIFSREWDQRVPRRLV